MCYITKWHCGSKMCYQWGICVTNVLPLDKISLTIVLKKVVYFADYKHITLPLNATILIPYCVTTDPMRVTKSKIWCEETLITEFPHIIFCIFEKQKQREQLHISVLLYMEFSCTIAAYQWKQQDISILSRLKTDCTTAVYQWKRRHVFVKPTITIIVTSYHQQRYWLSSTALPANITIVTCHYHRCQRLCFCLYSNGLQPKWSLTYFPKKLELGKPSLLLISLTLKSVVRK